MNDARLLAVLAAVFGALAGLMALLGLLVTPVALAAAALFGATAGLLWYHASGRLARAAVAGARRERRAADGAGPRGARSRAGRRRAGAAGARADQERRRRAAAYRTLGLDPGADDAAVRAAYRERSKETHPDSGGSTAQFRAVREAYERLGAP